MAQVWAMGKDRNYVHVGDHYRLHIIRDKFLVGMNMHRYVGMCVNIGENI